MYENMTVQQIKQTMFDKMIEGLASQKWEHSVENNSSSSCKYNGPNNRHCAVGWLFPDWVTADTDGCTASIAMDIMSHDPDRRTTGVQIRANNFVEKLGIASLNNKDKMEVLEFLRDVQRAHDQTTDGGRLAMTRALHEAAIMHDLSTVTLSILRDNHA